jgi:hypothetical protein
MGNLLSAVFENAVGAVALTPTTLTEADALMPSRLRVALNDLPIRHYMKRKYFLKLIQNQKLRLGRMDLQHKDRRLSFIHCWYEGDEENREMWRDFADDGSCVCIVSSTQSLIKAIQPSPKGLVVELDDAHYCGEDEQLPEFLPHLPSMRKDEKFIGENEITLLAEIDLQRAPVILETVPDFQEIPVDLSLLIRALIVGPMMCEEYAAALTERLRTIANRVDIRNSVYRGNWLA